MRTIRDLRDDVIGIDFAWQSERNATGIAVAQGEAAIVDVISGVRGMNDIVAIVERFATANGQDDPSA